MSVDANIILKQVLKNRMGWRRLDSSGLGYRKCAGVFFNTVMSLQFHKMWGNSEVAEKLLALQEGLTFMK